MLLKALGVCAGGYAPGVKRPEGRPRGPTDAVGYAQGYALTIKRHPFPFLDFRSGGDSRGGVMYPVLVSLKIWAIIRLGTKR